MTILLGLLALVALGGSSRAAPLEERQNCAANYGQCGGTAFSGPTCCVSGTTCVQVNEFYSQCQGSTPTGGGGWTPTEGAGDINQIITPSPMSMSSPAPAGPGTATWSDNPFAGVSLWANAYYASEVSTLAMPSLSPPLATKAAEVAKTPSFMWLDTLSKVPLMGDTLADIQAANADASTPYAGIFVVYDLPDRDCAAAASNGEYSIANNGVDNYKAYIDAIYEQITKYSDVLNILVVEPDSLANMVTNANVQKCAGAKAAYSECVQYAISKLNLPNVAMYLDAGHAGWLGWPANIGPAAKLFAQVWQDAGSPSQVRGLATNVANYNAWALTARPSYTQSDPNYDEQHYIHAIAPLLNDAGFPPHFIVDTSRSGVQPTKQQQWGDWCNVIGTGFGARPSTETGDALADSFVWIKPGGECDGTSNSSAPRYDYHCGSSDALQPSPQAGEWFQAYFEQLLRNANPPF